MSRHLRVLRDGGAGRDHATRPRDDARERVYSARAGAVRAAARRGSRRSSSSGACSSRRSRRTSSGRGAEAMTARADERRERSVIAGDRVSVTVRVEVEPDVAFEVFTTEIDRWWRRGIAYRVAGRRPGTLRLEPQARRPAVRAVRGAAGRRLHEAGRITAWEPPAPARVRVARLRTSARRGHATSRSRSRATESGATELRLVHRGFAALRPDHPVRHGEPAACSSARLGRWWGDCCSLGAARDARRRQG